MKINWQHELMPVTITTKRELLHKLGFPAFKKLRHLVILSFLL